MRIFQFCNWWWAKNDWYARTCACFLIFWVVPCLATTIFFGVKAVAAIVIGMLALISTVVICIISNFIYCGLCTAWSDFNDERPTEDIAILRKLKGIDTPSQYPYRPPQPGK
jgi:hypothetical protein